MNYESLTAYVTMGSIMVFVVGVAVYDVYIIAKKGKYFSVSAWMIRTSKKFPSIPFGIGLGVGMLAGHLFWSMNTKDIYLPDSPEMRELCKDVKNVIP